MKTTDAHVSDERIKQLMEWVEDRHLHGNAPARRIAHDLDMALLELKHRRALDRMVEGKE